MAHTSAKTISKVVKYFLVSTNMRLLVIAAFCASCVSCSLWPQGVVHYAINKKDYDLHSQDEITSTLARIQNEICVKFFNTPANYNASLEHKILYISNPDKRKDCPLQSYDFTGSVVYMPIGYRCINQKVITRIVVEMLKASIEQSVSPINSNDLVKRFQERDVTVASSTFLSPADRNYINAHYHTECGSLSQASARRLGDEREPTAAQLSPENEEYYKDKLWPLGVLMYGVHPNIRADDPDLITIKQAMSTIELSSCIVFQRISSLTDVLEPKNFLWLSYEGEELPYFGFLEGNQTVRLRSVASGAPGHSAHALHALLRALGVPMMSNRFDRDNYITVNWRNIASGKEHYLEKTPQAAYLPQLPYEFNSATHAPANYMCGNCLDPLASRTVLPREDHLWQRTLSMGRRRELTAGDAALLAVLYGPQCRSRFMRDLK